MVRPLTPQFVAAATLLFVGRVLYSLTLIWSGSPGVNVAALTDTWSCNPFPESAVVVVGVVAVVVVVVCVHPAINTETRRKNVDMIYNPRCIFIIVYSPSGLHTGMEPSLPAHLYFGL
jgi:hypothetical protein